MLSDHPKQRLDLTRIAGDAESAGETYGRMFQTAIIGFLFQETTPSPDRLKLAKRCWKQIEKHAPDSAAFMRGMARGIQLDVEHATLLTLHEELYPDTHCTGFYATGPATSGGKTFVGMTWDWSPSLYPWPGLLRLDIDQWPAMYTYHLPGLWAGAGVNEHGLGFMWTASGRFPGRETKTGVPTYVLISEILRRKTVEEALAWLDATPRAGSFIFFFADPSGDAALIEGMTQKLGVVRESAAFCRANHFECQDMVALSQQVPPREKQFTTRYRSKRMAEMLKQHDGQINTAIAKQMLTDRDGDWPWLNQYPITPSGARDPKLRAMTLDALLVACDSATLYTCRGGREIGPWQRLRF